MNSKKMNVEIWSDVTCTFCYTAKRQFEEALSQFKNRDKVHVIWKSFELAPGLKTDADKKLPRFLAELKGISIEQAQGMTDHVSNSAKEVGLTFNLNEAIPANSFDAHRISHMAKEYDLQERAEERLFKAYFTEGRNIDDIPTLIELATEIGLDSALVKNVLRSTRYANEVRQDIDEARQAGITSVPHYIINSTNTVSGAQSSAVFLSAVEKAFAQWELENDHAISEMNEGQSCKIGEDCH
jgi:predicted DsbA family dithiol-disulfide isomerase